MFDRMKLGGFFAAGALAVGLATATMTGGAAEAATIAGQIDISGTVNLGTSDFSATGNVDLNDPGVVMIADGDFASVPLFSLASLNDFDFSLSNQVIWAAGAFTFVATSFSNIVDGATKSFSAWGVIKAAGFDDTQGLMTFSTQTNGAATSLRASFSSTTAPVPVPAAGFLLVGALGGLAALRRRKAAA